MEQGHKWRWAWGVLGTLLLAACASTGPAPVEDRSGGQPRAPRATPSAPGRSNAPSHRVERGDTLYGIAFRNGLDYRDLATWNRIEPPYTIHVGQVLRLEPPSHAPAVASRAPAKAPAATTPGVRPAATAAAPTPFGALESTPTKPPVATDAPAPSAAAAPRPPAGTPPPSAAAPTTAPPPASGPATPANEVAPAAPATANAAAAQVVGEVSWRWPAAGTLVGSFAAGDPTRQGIDIAGKSGDAVRAAAAGSVVYSGNGLVGYGELIIIKHNASFLSAYGHNRKRMVREGEQVQAGQVIAEMGSSSASRDSLHFEIRRNGKPVNPLDYLPRR